MYLHYLNLPVRPPTTSFLIDLYQRHLACVPYELTSKMYYAKTNRNIPTSDDFASNLVERGWGGNCYILNIHFMRLLEALGFWCYLVKVSPGHIGIIVSIQEQDYFVDVGYGAPLNQLVPIQDSPWSSTIFQEKIVIKYKEKNQLIYDRSYKGNVFLSKTIDLEPIEETDIEPDIEASFVDKDDNSFMRRINMVLTTDDKYMWVRNNRLTIRTDNNEEIKDYSHSSEWLKDMHQMFGLRMEDLQWTIDYLKQRNVDLGFID